MIKTYVRISHLIGICCFGTLFRQNLSSWGKLCCSLNHEEIKKEFGNDMAITLAGSEFETNGQIDMKKLGEEILKTIGADTTVNYSKNGTPANEVHQVKYALDALGVKNISFDQVKKLCKYYDIPVEGKYDCSLKNIGIKACVGR